MPRSSIQLNYIDIDTLNDTVNQCIEDYCSMYGIDLSNYNQRVNIRHNEVNNILLYCYDHIFKPDKTLINNQRSLIDYNSIEQLTVVIDVFIRVCLFFNKSLGLMSLCMFTGIDDNTIQRWSSEEGKKSNPTRWALLKKVKEYNKNALVSNLKDTPVGALAVANNDKETGLEWGKNQAQQITNNTVYLLPSERVDKLRLQAPED